MMKDFIENFKLIFDSMDERIIVKQRVLFLYFTVYYVKGIQNRSKIVLFLKYA